VKSYPSRLSAQYRATLRYFDFPEKGPARTVRGVGSMHHVALKAHPDRLRSIITTLKERNISYSLHGSPESGSLYVHDPDDILVEVEDSGIGLDPTSIDQIFESMFTTKPDGMGMGLSISRSIVAAHGGRLWASPRDGFGAIFRIVLPTDVSGNGIVGQASPDPQVIPAQNSEAHGNA